MIRLIRLLIRISFYSIVRLADMRVLLTICLAMVVAGEVSEFTDKLMITF